MVTILLFLSTKLFKFEIQKYCQILRAHKPYFLMPGYIFKFGYHDYVARLSHITNLKHGFVICICSSVATGSGHPDYLGHFLSGSKWV